MNILEQVLLQIQKESECPIATCYQNQARVRSMSLLKFENKLYIVTGKQSSKYKELLENDSFELYLTFEEDLPFWYIRIRGHAIFMNDQTLKHRIYSEFAWIKEYWDNEENPLFTVIECQPTAIEYMKKGSMESEIYEM